MELFMDMINHKGSPKNDDNGYESPDDIFAEGDDIEYNEDGEVTYGPNTVFKGPGIDKYNRPPEEMDFNKPFVVKMKKPMTVVQTEKWTRLFAGVSKAKQLKILVS